MRAGIVNLNTRQPVVLAALLAGTWLEGRNRRLAGL
jgi:hypothetical protein